MHGEQLPANTGIYFKKSSDAKKPADAVNHSEESKRMRRSQIHDCCWQKSVKVRFRSP
jgi:hypothetical protein